MKEIVAQYGTAVIATIVGAALLYVMCHIPMEGRQGIAQVVGLLTEQQTQESIQIHYEQNEEQYMLPMAMELTYINENPIIVGEKTKVWDHFQICGGKEKASDAKICVILDEQGNRYSAITENGQEYLYIERAGVYQVYFRTTDQFCRTQYAVLSIPVQVRKQ